MSGYRIIGAFFSTLLCFQFAIAAPSQRVSFSRHYVQIYQTLKTSHDLARAAAPYKKSNRNVAYMISKLETLPAQALPQVSLRGNRLVFKDGTKTYELIALGGSKFSLDGQRIDIKDDLSKTFSQSSLPINFWLPEAHAVAPIIVGIIIFLGVVFGAGVCINSSIEDYFGTKEIIPKWEKSDQFNRYWRKLKQELKPLCPGAAWADSPSDSDFDYALFFQNYCSSIKSKMKTSGEVANADFDTNTAGLFYGAADEADQAIVQEIWKDANFRNSCIANPNLSAATANGETEQTVQ